MSKEPEPNLANMLASTEADQMPRPAKAKRTEPGTEPSRSKPETEPSRSKPGTDAEAEYRAARERNRERLAEAAQTDELAHLSPVERYRVRRGLEQTNLNLPLDIKLRLQLEAVRRGLSMSALAAEIFDAALPDDD